MAKAKKKVDVWYVSQDEEVWNEAGAERDHAIEYGREAYDGEGFHIGVGERFPICKELFDAVHIGDLIDDRNEDAGWEDGLCAEVSKAELEELTRDINRVFSRWAKKIDLEARGRGLFISEQEWIDHTPEFLADVRRVSPHLGY